MLFGALFFLIAAIGHLYFAIDVSYILLVPSFILFGLAWAIVNQAPAVALGQSIHEDHLSVAMGALFSFYNIGVAVMLALGVTLFHSRAMQSLLQGFASENFQIDAAQQHLLTQFVNQPDQMQHILPQLSFPPAMVTGVFENAFMTGMHAMFWPLIVLVVIAFTAIKWRMRKSVRVT